MTTRCGPSQAELQRALQASPTQPFAFACRATGFGLTAARAGLKRGDLPFRVIRCGRALRVPSVDLERLLLAATESATTETATETVAAATDLEEQQ